MVSKEELRKIVREELRSQKTPSSEAEEGHKVHEDYGEAVDCPDCLPAIAKAFWDKRKNLEYECDGCGLPVKEEETCPACGSKEQYIR